MRKLYIFIGLIVSCSSNFCYAESKIDLKGFHGKIRAQLNELGYLSELNGKYLIRVTEVRIDSQGYMKDHHHSGPGIRCVISGELTYVINNQKSLYKTGDCFTERGDITHTSANPKSKPVKLLNFELLPNSVKDHENSLLPVR
ncbi:MAG: cupin domain-containing protein [Methylocystis sp.]